MAHFDGAALVQNLTREWAYSGLTEGRQAFLKSAVQVCQVVSSAILGSLCSENAGSTERLSLQFRMQCANFGHRAFEFLGDVPPQVDLERLRSVNNGPVEFSDLTAASVTELVLQLRERLADDLHSFDLLPPPEGDDEAFWKEWPARVDKWLRERPHWKNKPVPVIPPQKPFDQVEVGVANKQLDAAFDPLIVGVRRELTAAAKQNAERAEDIGRLAKLTEEVLSQVMGMHIQVVGSEVGYSIGMEDFAVRRQAIRLTELMGPLSEQYRPLAPLLRLVQESPPTTLGLLTESYVEAVLKHAYRHLQVKELEDLKEGSAFLKIHPEYRIWRGPQESSSPPAATVVSSKPEGTRSQVAKRRECVWRVYRANEHQLSRSTEKWKDLTALVNEDPYIKATGPIDRQTCINDIRKMPKGPGKRPK